MPLKILGKNFFIPLLFLLLTSLSGCVYLVIGSFGALGGYVISPDTVEGVIGNKDMDQVLDATVQIISIMGTIQERNDAGGVLIAKVQGNKVTIILTQLSKSSVKLTVKARKAFLPKIRVAQDVYIKIVTRVNE